MFFLLFRAQPVLLLPPHDQNKQAHQSQYLSERKEVGKVGGGGVSGRHADCQTESFYPPLCLMVPF